ncbi:hypothetical protein EVAR_42394_1 [Eumeta japonica]|uniref:Uncharacterized protein n=1 Tax=Eumeta variegata TaxID=151549 RepID=A0A4C1YFK1_EUMVA|nr:hypothetical protein EVAR_42394_1 [Eumeta japonica]
MKSVSKNTTRPRIAEPKKQANFLKMGRKSMKPYRPLPHRRSLRKLLEHPWNHQCPHIVLHEQKEQVDAQLVKSLVAETQLDSEKKLKSKRGRLLECIQGNLQVLDKLNP